MGRVRTYAVACGCAVVAAAVVRFTDEGDSIQTSDSAALWEYHPSEVVELVYESGGALLRVRPDTVGGRHAWWAVETDSTGTRSYPLGSAGREVIRSLVELRPARDLGTVDSLAGLHPFGLDRPSARLLIDFGRDERELWLGKRVPAGEERYALLVRGGSAPGGSAGGRAGAASVGPSKLVALHASMILPLELGQGALRVRRLHDFLEGRVSTVRFTVDAREGRLERRPDGSWAVEGSRPAPSRELLEHAWRLAISEFRPIPGEGELRKLVSVWYADAQRGDLGWLELFKEAGERPAYWLATERTGVPALADPVSAARVEEAIGRLF